MKKIVYIIAAAALMAGLAGCQTKTEKVVLDSVDLRYRVADSYELSATSPKPFTIIVKSTKPWTITNEHPDWCIIEQEEGTEVPDSLVHVGKGENTYVKVQYYDNTELDDRTDHITIASAGFVGKTVNIYQKGIAYLHVPDEEQAFDVIKAGGEITFHVVSNQNWSAAVTEIDGDWLTVTDGATGSLDGTVTVTAAENSGWMRYAAVSVFVRHGDERATIQITQDGVLLDPETEELHVNYNDETAKIEVVANTKWVASTEDGWFTIVNPDNHDGNDTLNLTVTSNAEGEAIRKGSITFKTVPANEGDASASKTIVIKQSYPLASTKVMMDNDEIANWKSDKGEDPVYDAGIGGTTFFQSALGYARLNRSMKAGNYSFHWSTFSDDVRVRHWFCYSDGQEVKFDLKASGATSASFNNGSSAKPSEYGSGLSGIDMTTDHVMSYVFTQDGDYCHVQLQVDGKDAYAFNSSADVMNMVKWGASINMYIGVETGSAVLDWYEYTPPFSWDEE